MERHFEKELAGLSEKLFEMGSKAEQMIDNAVQSLVERKSELCSVVYDIENEVNRLQIEIDELALRLLATQQPMAVDLRFLVVVMKINGELERIGDQAVNICQNTQMLLEQPPLKPLIDIPRMAEQARKMVRESLEALMKRDAILAKAVIMEDDRVDALKDQIFRELLTYMISDPKSIQRALALILISRNLERIGDKATDIAEEVIYMVQGRDVRHPERR